MEIRIFDNNNKTHRVIDLGTIKNKPPTKKQWLKWLWLLREDYRDMRKYNPEIL